MGISSRLSILGFFGHAFTSSFLWSLNLFFKMIRNLQRHSVTWHDISLAPGSHLFRCKFSIYGCLHAKLSKLHVLEHFSMSFHLCEHSTGFRILYLQKVGNIAPWSSYILTYCWKILISLLLLCVYPLELSYMSPFIPLQELTTQSSSQLQALFLKPSTHLSFLHWVK